MTASQPQMVNKFAQGWLDSQCQAIDGLRCAILLLHEPAQGSFRPVAQSPLDSRDAPELIPIAETAIKKQHKAVNASVKAGKTDDHIFDYMALPIFSQTTLVGVIALKLAHRPQEKQQEISDFLEKSSKWIESGSFNEQSASDIYAKVVRLISGCFEQESFTRAISAVISQLAASLGCERVSMGRLKRHHIQVHALSGSASFDPKSNIVRTIAESMDEAVDQDAIIVYPSAQDSSTYVNRAHGELARKFGSGSICTVPLVNNQSVFGALTLERSEDRPFDAETLRMLEQTAALIGPFLALQQHEERWLLAKIWDSACSTAKNLLGFRYLKTKLSLILLSGLLGYGLAVEGHYQVKAEAVLEGRIQREVVASIDGYVASAAQRAGDVVRKGQVLAMLDARDLNLERLKISSRHQQIVREYREAMAIRDRVKVRVLSAEIEQNNAELKLIDEQLKRTQIVAPFDGIVIEGDLSQSLGSPVERGDTLFKVAPLDGYRVVLTVDERLIAHTREGQPGFLALSSLPDQVLAFTVDRITTVANVKDGYNGFRVDATLQDAVSVLRPGMQGIGKIDAGQKRLLWIWTHELVDWFRLWIWSFWP